MLVAITHPGRCLNTYSARICIAIIFKCKCGHLHLLLCSSSETALSDTSSHLDSPSGGKVTQQHSSHCYSAPRRPYDHSQDTCLNVWISRYLLFKQVLVTAAIALWKSKAWSCIPSPCGCFSEGSARTLERKDILGFAPVLSTFSCLTQNSSTASPGRSSFSRIQVHTSGILIHAAGTKELTFMCSWSLIFRARRESFDYCSLHPLHKKHNHVIPWPHFKICGWQLSE